MLMRLRKNLSNVIGWQTKRKIVVFESDDWGSIRIKNKEAYLKMIDSGLELDKSNFTMYDALESNTDLEMLFEVLRNHKDSTGRYAVFTPMCVVANPDFKKIKESNFEDYYYELFNETCNRYSDHDKVYSLWLLGIKERLFVPQLHGREHLNVRRWMNALKAGNKGLKLAFDYESIGPSWFNGQRLPEHLAAFDPDLKSDIPALKQIVWDAGEIFENLCGYKPRNFIASNSPEPRILEQTFKEIGIKYLTRYKMQRYPLGDGKFEKQFNWLGKRNKIGQIYLVRNAGFEPSSPNVNNSVDNCIEEIQIAFRWNKPAIVSTHRVNYIGYISKNNRERGLILLDTLLKKIIDRWPEVEFMTSEELGDIISSNVNLNYENPAN